MVLNGQVIIKCKSLLMMPVAGIVFYDHLCVYFDESVFIFACVLF